jgi:hypothetical protein
MWKSSAYTVFNIRCLIFGKVILAFIHSRKKSNLNHEFVEVRQNELSTPNPYRLYPELLNPDLN